MLESTVQKARSRSRADCKGVGWLGGGKDLRILVRLHGGRTHNCIFFILV